LRSIIKDKMQRTHHQTIGEALLEASEGDDDRATHI
jgi:hypothetical protein